MNPSFWYAVRYQVEAQCLSPLRTGGTDGDTETVLTGPDGVHFLQGSSLAGGFRDWVTGCWGPEMAGTLFGSNQAEGSLVISDGRFDSRTAVQQRPRLRIDRVRGTADKGGKFDLAQVAAGSRFCFEMVWRGTELCPEQQQAVKAMLEAMNSGEIRLGAQKNNGLGRVQLTVHQKSFDMHQEADRTAWLEETGAGTLLPLEAAAPMRTVFVLEGKVDGLLVKAAAAQAKAEEKGSYTPNLEENGMPVLPGSAIKGVVRSWAERIVKSSSLPESVTDKLFGCSAGARQEGLAGRVRVEDLQLNQAQKCQISRIRINRFTGGVIRQGLMTEEPLSTPVRLELSVTQPTGLERALLVYALRDLGLGLYSLGSGWAIGRGVMQADRLTVCQPDGTKAVLFFQEGRANRLEDPNGLMAGWMKAWKENRV